MKFINLTPHPLTIIDGERSTQYPIDGPAPRLAVDRQDLGTCGGHAIVRSTMGEPSGLPDQQDGIVLIVSALVAEHPSVAKRTDLAYPGEAVRDDSGKIIGARGLCAGPGLAGLLADVASATEFTATCGGDMHVDNGEFTVGSYSTFEAAKAAAIEYMESHQWAYFYGCTVSAGPRLVWCRHGHWQPTYYPLEKATDMVDAATAQSTADYYFDDTRYGGHKD